MRASTPSAETCGKVTLAATYHSTRAATPLHPARRALFDFDGCASNGGKCWVDEKKYQWHLTGLLSMTPGDYGGILKALGVKLLALAVRNAHEAAKLAVVLKSHAVERVLPAIAASTLSPSRSRVVDRSFTSFCRFTHP